MVKVLSLRIQQCFSPFTILLVEESSETGILDIYLSRFSRVRKFKNTSAISVMFFLKMFKIECKFRKRTEKLRKSVMFFEIIASEDFAINCLA